MLFRSATMATRKQYNDDIQSYSLRLVRETVLPYHQINNPQKVVNMVNELFNLDERPEEHAVIIGFDAKLNPVGVFMLSHGNISSSIVSPPEVFKRLMLCNASRFILVHNHPSGSCTPSTNDKQLNQRLKDAGILLNIQLNDSLIIGHECFYSDREQHPAFYAEA